MKPENIFSVLHICAGAPLSVRGAFLDAMQSGAEEIRFGGNLGFGGKYWPASNTVTYNEGYMDKFRRAVVADTNKHLAVLAAHENS